MAQATWKYYGNTHDMANSVHMMWITSGYLVFYSMRSKFSTPINP